MAATGLTIRELFARLNQVDESHEIEAKRSESELGKSALDTISAFANEPGLGGGYLLFGVVEDETTGVCTVNGVKNPKKLEQELSTTCASAFNRTIRPKVWTEVVDDVSLVAAFVPEVSSSEKPVFDKKRGMQHGAFRRIGSTDQRCTEDDLRVLFQSSSVAPYEDTVVADATMEDLDKEIIGAYRRSLIEANPATELRDAELDELVQALGGAKRVNGNLAPTVAGVLLFGKRLSLRRLFPAARVDYIRVPGTEWVPDAERRYESIEVREPLLAAFRRIYNAVVDDLPKSFTLEAGSPERKDQLALPESAVREALVNALTHRDYRVPSTSQVIRYQDRIEVRNPGYSLVDDEQLGEPGSFPRNPRISDVFREMRLAENKGTGVAAIRRAMHGAGLTPPFFGSDRTRNQFVVTLWLHNLIGEDDTQWLRSFAAMKLSDEQARALVVARRTGSVTNAMLRAISGLDTLSASTQLRQLRDQALLELRGKGSATHYVLGPKARPAAAGAGLAPAGLSPAGVVKTGGFGDQTGGLSAQTGGLPEENRGAQDDVLEVEALLQNAPAPLREAVTALGGKPSPSDLRKVIVQLCELRWWTPKELASVLKRKDVSHLSEKHLSPLVKDSKLERRYPDNLAHPSQAYRAVQPSLLGSEQEGSDE
jgi:ATP-dependent DNA helicase RecG